MEGADPTLTVWQSRNGGRGIPGALGASATPNSRSKGSQPHWNLLSPGSCARQRIPITSGCETWQGLWLSEREGCLLVSQVLPRRCRCRQFLADRLTCSELQCWGSSLKSASDKQGGTALSGFRERDGGAAFSQTEVQAEVTDCLLTLPPHSLHSYQKLL